MFWTHQNIRRILLDFVQKVIPNSHKNGKLELYVGNDLAQDFGLSSMQIVELAAYINSFFHFFDSKNPPSLLTDSLLDNWVQKVLDVRMENDEFLSFQSSGTTGNSKIIKHSIEFINCEVEFLKGILHQPKRIISFVPTNHIYGFLFALVLPQYWGIPIVFISQLDKCCFESDDLIIATPFNWQFIYDSLNNKTCNCAGVSSGAPLNDQLYNQLLNLGIGVTEIFGSTETAGIGFRHKPFKPFEFFPYWTFN